MFREFVLPHIAAPSSMFGLVYSGCCEPVHGRLDLSVAEIPNLRSMSVSGWSDPSQIAEILGSRYVYSRKPTPALVSGANPPWDSARKGMETTQKVTRNCCLGIPFRDLYSVNRERSRSAEWVSVTRSVLGI